ncbi:MAG TPA: NAD-dependent epimerase/dehydratase family protein [Gemmatimonadaceae bacterium]|jgi:2'-hydroxyisoflavone reductase|nr:NAD-dependent epimerase/dehydratase family protein [Gemmatimonadaceae bacterium]
MSTDRRTFLKLSAAAGGALALSGTGGSEPLGAATVHPATPRNGATEKAPAPLNILILGGTGFTGPEQVDYALERGHKVTLFNRNRTRPDMFKGKVDQLIGDLSGDVSALRGKKFDVVLDNPTTLPFWVRNAAQHLKGNVGHYIFISTISVYPDNSVPGADETAPTTPMPAGVDPYTTVREHAGQYYGALKTFSEQEVARQYGNNHTIVRPGLIVGPLDRSDRFTYWPARIDRGGEVLAPGTPDDPAQYIDSRDLAEFMVRLAENKVFGTFNATGPAKPTTMAETLYGIKAVTTAGASFTWVPSDFLQAQGVRGWRHMPIWLPPSGQTAGFLRRSIAKALAAGLTFRPLADTAKATLDWHKTRPEAEQKAMLEGRIAGIPPEKEAEVLAAWKARG